MFEVFHRFFMYCMYLVIFIRYKVYTKESKFVRISTHYEEIIYIVDKTQKGVLIKHMEAWRALASLVPSEFHYLSFTYIFYNSIIPLLNTRTRPAFEGWKVGDVPHALFKSYICVCFPQLPNKLINIDKNYPHNVWVPLVWQHKSHFH